MRAGLAGLTMRGRLFLAAAAGATLAALLLGEKDLLRVAALLAALPLLAAYYVTRARYHLSATRRITPTKTSAGSTASVAINLNNLSRLPTGALLLEDQIPYALGSRPRLILDRLLPQHTTTVTYALRADTRGRYPIGPLTLRISDPFGLCELTRAFAAIDHLTVHPVVHRLPPVRLPTDTTGTGDTHHHHAALHGEDDTATRVYRHGDDLRRVHWKSTARAGQLMVRREEQPHHRYATIVLDTRARAHYGEGPTASFEWAITATASLATHLLGQDYQLHLVTGSQQFSHPSAEIVLDHLAQLTTSTDLHSPAAAPTTGLLIAVLATGHPLELTALTRTQHHPKIAILQDTTTWQASAQANAHHVLAEKTLRQHGFTTITATHATNTAQLWTQIAARKPRLARS